MSNISLARFDKEDGDEQMLDEIVLYIVLNINQNLTQNDIDNIIVRFQLNNKFEIKR